MKTNKLMSTKAKESRLIKIIRVTKNKTLMKLTEQ